MRLKPCAPSADGDSTADRAATVGKDQGMSDLHRASRSQQLGQAIHALLAALQPFPDQGTPTTLPSWGAYAPSGSVPPQTVLPDSAPWS